MTNHAPLNEVLDGYEAGRTARQCRNMARRHFHQYAVFMRYRASGIALHPLTLMQAMCHLEEATARRKEGRALTTAFGVRAGFRDGYITSL